MTDIKHVLKHHSQQNIPLNFDEAYSLGEHVLRGCRGDHEAQVQSLMALSSLHSIATYGWKREERQEDYHGHYLPKNSAEQIAGICAAIFKQDIAVSEFGFLEPNISYAMDNCGMGGDLVVTANVSTIAAFIAVADGIAMCKHGSPANADEGKYGSSDFISLICGINEYASKKEVEECLEKIGFGYTEACDIRYKSIHIQTHNVAKAPHMNDIIGPITNPLSPRKMTRRVVGINHLIAPRIVAEAYQILNEKGITHLQHGIFVRGFADESRYRGMDEVSICSGGTRVADLKDGIIREYDLFAPDFGLEPIPVEAVSPIGNKGEYSLKILKGEIDGPGLKFVLANAAILFYLAGRAADLGECYKLAEQTFRGGGAYEVMLAVRKKLPKDLRKRR
ncbi:hypothetical protein KKD19_01055 [Patescibacteria group bacterium]|nr:hypothetical protein [Patescibacteria group bacterium]